MKQAAFVASLLVTALTNAEQSKPIEGKLQILRKEIDVANSPVLYDGPLTPETFQRDWTVHNSKWWMEDGWLCGKNPASHPGMVILKKDFPGNVLVEFEARTVKPSTHDINVMWNGSYFDEALERGPAYVAGIAGWWSRKIGLEKSPEYKLVACTPLFDFEPGRIYKIIAGSIDGHLFVFVDGKLMLELTDPKPIDNQKYAKVGFEAYSSHIQVRNIIIRQISWKPLELKYDAEF